MWSFSHPSVLFIAHRKGAHRCLPKSSRTSHEWLLEEVEKTLLYEVVRCGHFSSVFSRLLPCFHTQMLISVPIPFLLSKIRYL